MSRHDHARQTLQLRMADENPEPMLLPLCSDTSFAAMNWLKKTLRENAGQNSDEAAPVQPKEDDASVASGSADYSFKFSSKFQDKFQDMDVEAALSSAVDAAPRPVLPYPNEHAGICALHCLWVVPYALPRSR
eukprot:702561-Rhodomonas_salina.1